MNLSRYYLLNEVSRYVSKNGNCEFLLGEVERYIWKNEIDEEICKYKKIGWCNPSFVVKYPEEFLNFRKLNSPDGGLIYTLFERCIDSIKTHYENLGYGIRFLTRPFGYIDGNAKNKKLTCECVEIYIGKNHSVLNLEDIKEDLKKELKNRFIVFEDSDVENLSKGELFLFYKIPSLQWGKFWKDKMNERKVEK